MPACEDGLVEEADWLFCAAHALGSFCFCLCGSMPSCWGLVLDSVSPQYGSTDRGQWLTSRSWRDDCGCCCGCSCPVTFHSSLPLQRLARLGPRIRCFLVRGCVCV